MLETSAFRISVWWPIYIINSVQLDKGSFHGISSVAESTFRAFWCGIS